MNYFDRIWYLSGESGKIQIIWYQLNHISQHHGNSCKKSAHANLSTHPLTLARKNLSGNIYQQWENHWARARELELES